MIDPEAASTGELESLLYTHCRPGESLTGDAGFGFQAASPGAGAAARAAVADHLLHDTLTWTDGEAADQPQSLAHVQADGWYATALGTPLGTPLSAPPAESTDAPDLPSEESPTLDIVAPERNHLTHAVVTTDDAAYGALRPAQLWNADLWLTDPIPPGPADTIAAGWTPGLTLEDVRSYITEEEWRTEWLVALHSILSDRDDQRRIILIGDDPGEILTWITAVTLLLPRWQALRTGFRVFTSDPFDFSPHRIVGVHTGQVADGVSPAYPHGAHVFELASRLHSLVHLDPASQDWVDLFTTGNLDRLLDAVDFAAASGLAASPAMSLARACYFETVPPRRDAGKVANWLVCSTLEQYAQRSPGLLDMLLDYPDPPYDLLVALDDLATMGRLGGHGARIRLALLESERRDVAEVGIYRPDRLDDLPGEEWQSEHRDQAIKVLTEALNTVHPDRFHLVLRLAERFQIEHPEWEPAAATRFIAWWAENPHLSPDPGTGPGGEALRERLRAVLRHKCEADYADADRIGHAWSERAWLWFDGPDFDDALYCACLTTMMATSDEISRVDLATQQLRAVEPDDVEWAVKVLWRRCSPGPAEWRLLADELSPGTRVDQGLFTPLRDELLNSAARLQPVWLNIAVDLIRNELFDDTDVSILVTHDATLRELAQRPDSEDELFALTDYLVETPQLLRLHESTVIDALSHTRLLHAILSLLHRCSHAGQDRYALSLLGRLDEPTSARDLYSAYIVITRQLAGGARIRRLESILHSILAEEGEPLTERATQVVADLDEALHQEFLDYIDRIRAEAGTPLVRRILGAVFEPRSS